MAEYGYILNKYPQIHSQSPQNHHPQLKRLQKPTNTNSTIPHIPSSDPFIHPLKEQDSPHHPSLRSAAVLHLPILQALVGPILDQHQFEAGQELQAQQLADPAAVLEAALDEHLVVAGLDQPDVLPPVQHRFVGGRPEQTPPAGVRRLGEGALQDLTPDLVHLAVQGLQLGAELRQLGLLEEAVPRAGDAVDQTQVVELFDHAQGFVEGVVLGELLRGTRTAQGRPHLQLGHHYYNGHMLPAQLPEGGVRFRQIEERAVYRCLGRMGTSGPKRLSVMVCI